MLNLFRRQLAPAASGPPRPPAPAVVRSGGRTLEVAPHLQVTPEGFPQPDWDAFFAFIGESRGDDEWDAAWLGCRAAWLLHLRDALGPGYWLHEGETAILSSFDPRRVRTAEESMLRTLSRVERVLDGLAEPAPGTRVLIVLDDEEAYCRYAAQFDADGGEYASSGGSYISWGMSHFITMKRDIVSIEPVVAHELAHACLGDLSLPLWLNEGLAVNTEQRICGAGHPEFTPLEMHAKHIKFWNDETIQEFWSGTSFRRPDDGNRLSYDLGRILVEQLSGGDWARFAAFVGAAHRGDAGASAAARELEVDLGASVAALVGRNGADWAPDPQRWKQPETQTE